MKTIAVHGIVPNNTKPLVDADTRSAVIQNNINALKNGCAGMVSMSWDDAQDVLVAVLAAGDIQLGDTVSKSMRPLNKDRKTHGGSIHGTIQIH